MPFRVLTLDGGGAWALIEVRTLIDLYGENATGHEVLQNFDLVAANSGGSIVLAGLVEDLPLLQIAQYFLDERNRRSIFSPTTKPLDAILGQIGIGPKYSASNKLPALQALLPNSGAKLLDGIMSGVDGPSGKPVHLLIVGFDYDLNSAVFFRSAPAGSKGDWGEGQPAEVTLAGAVHASTNAPVLFFDAPADLPNAQDEFWDGGITGCNNPAVIGVVEAIVLGNSPQNIVVLALGTGHVSLPLAAPGERSDELEMPRMRSSPSGDLKKLAGAILDDPPDAATFIAHVVTSGKAALEPPAISRVVRMNPLVSPTPLMEEHEYRLPSGWTISEFLKLAQTDMDAVAQDDIERIDRYCATWLQGNAPNQAIRASSTKFDPWGPEIGYAKFDEAKAAWSQLFQPPIAIEDAAQNTEPDPISAEPEL
jgi:hypothetical protein